VCLLKHVYAKVDYLAEAYALHYLRTKDGQEVDFALVNDKVIEQVLYWRLPCKNLGVKCLWVGYNIYT